MSPSKWTTHRRRIWRIVCLIFLALLLPGPPDTGRHARIQEVTTPYRFNYIAWELETLWEKFKQEFLGYQTYIPPENQKQTVLDYLIIINQIIEVSSQLDQIYADTTLADPAVVARPLEQRYSRLREEQRALQFIAEPIIERQVSHVLREQGFGIGGQIIPPVAFRFMEPPDILVVSPRHTIRQDYAFSLRPLTMAERSQLESEVEAVSPDDSAWITGVGGVGIWPSMVIETPHPAIAFEIVAHEWVHQYLITHPIGYEYFLYPETRIINETTATIFGNRVALLVLQEFYADEVARGELWLPDYPTLADFQLIEATERKHIPDASQPFNHVTDNRVRYTVDYLLALDRTSAADITLRVWSEARTARGFLPERTPESRTRSEPPVQINRTRITTDYLLALGRVDAAEAWMESNRQQMGMRVLNQAWFAFRGGYQADFGQGSGVAYGVTDVTDPAYAGDPTGPAIHEISARSTDLYIFLEAMKSVTSYEGLIETLIDVRKTSTLP